MDAALLALLACPDDGEALDVQPPGLACPRCRATFPEEGGVLRLLPAALRAALDTARGETGEPRRDLDPVALQASEARLRDEESSLYDDLYPSVAHRHELATCARLIGAAPGETILDVGAGTGRVVKEYAAARRRVVAADFSLESLRVLTARADLASAQVNAVQAEASRLPFRSGVFDAAVSLDLLCFLSTEELRTRFVDELARVLKPGGRLVLSTYHHAAIKRLWAASGRTEGALKEGFHSGGRVWYRNDSRRELVDTLSRRFVIDEVRGLCHRVPLLSNASARLAGSLDALLDGLPGAATLLATELVVRARRKD